MTLQVPESRALYKVDEPCRFDAPKVGRTMIWEVSEFCNLRCLHCCTSSGPEVSTRDDVPLDRMLAVAAELGDEDVRYVLFSGGEPLLMKDFLSVVEAVDHQRTSIFLATNGTLIDREVARRLKRSSVSLDISLDGPTAETHNAIRVHPSAFRRTIRGIEACVAEGVTLRVGAVVTPQSAPYLEQWMELLDGMGVTRVCFQTVVPFAGRAKEYPELMLPEALRVSSSERIQALQARYDGRILIERRISTSGARHKGPGCPAGSNYLHINRVGNVSPCSYLYKLDAERYTLGNIRRESLHDCVARSAERMAPLLAATEWCPLGVAERARRHRSLPVVAA